MQTTTEAPPSRPQPALLCTALVAIACISGCGAPSAMMPTTDERDKTQVYWAIAGSPYMQKVCAHVGQVGCEPRIKPSSTACAINPNTYRNATDALAHQYGIIIERVTRSGIGQCRLVAADRYLAVSPHTATAAPSDTDCKFVDDVKHCLSVGKDRLREYLKTLANQPGPGERILFERSQFKDRVSWKTVHVARHNPNVRVTDIASSKTEALVHFTGNAANARPVIVTTNGVTVGKKVSAGSLRGGHFAVDKSN